MLCTNLICTVYSVLYGILNDCSLSIFFFESTLELFKYFNISTYHAYIHYRSLAYFTRFDVIFFSAIAIFTSKYLAASTLTMQALYGIPLHMIRLISTLFYFCVEIWLPPEWRWKKAHCAELEERSMSIKRTWYLIIIMYSFVWFVRSLFLSLSLASSLDVCVCVHLFLFSFWLFCSFNPRFTLSTATNWIFQSQRRLNLVNDFNKPNKNKLTRTHRSHPTSWWLYLNHTQRVGQL